MTKTPTCKWMSDDFSEICCNDKCPLCADFCPVIATPDVCKWEEREEEHGAV